MDRIARKLLPATALALVGTTVLCAIGATPATPAPRDYITAHTEPIRRVQMTFPGIGIVRKVVVEEGQAVKKGDVLAIQDTDIEMGELDRLKLEAESEARMKFAQTDRDYKQKVYERKSKADGGVFSPSEIEEAFLDVARSDAQIQVTKEDTMGSNIKLKQEQVKIDKMTLRSEVDGVVESIRVHEGELTSLDPDKPSIVVVQNDPCFVVIRELLTWQVAQIKVGDTLMVKYKDETEWRPAKIVYKTPFADASSDIQVIKLEFPNPQHRDTGLPIDVKLPANLLQRPGAELASPR